MLALARYLRDALRVSAHLAAVLLPALWNATAGGVRAFGLRRHIGNLLWWKVPFAWLNI